MNYFSVLLSTMLVMGMYLASDVLGTKEIIFPVIAALVLGVWVAGNPLWTRSLPLIWLSPTLASIIGIVASKLYPTHPMIAIPVLLLLAAAQLTFLRSEVAPSIAIMLLPTFLEVQSWYYVISVSFFCGVIAIVQLMKERNQKQERKDKNTTIPVKNYLADKAIQWMYVYIGVLVIACISYLTDWSFIIVPPLVVTLFEFLRKDSLLKNRSLSLIALISLSSLLGVLFLKFFHYYIGLPLWFTAGFIIASVSVLFNLFKLSFGPSAAISLLPTILPSSELWVYPLQITLGITLLITLGTFFIQIDQKLRKKTVHQTPINYPFR